jgi:hypothetical protein
MQPVQSAIAQGNGTDVSKDATFPSPTTPGNAIVVPVATFHGSQRQIEDSFANVYTLLASLPFGESTVEVWAANNINGGINHKITLGATEGAYPALAGRDLRRESILAAGFCG